MWEVLMAYVETLAGVFLRKKRTVKLQPASWDLLSEELLIIVNRMAHFLVVIWSEILYGSILTLIAVDRVTMAIPCVQMHQVRSDNTLY